MKLWADFYDWILPDLPGVTTAIADFNIRATAIAFMKESGVYVVDQDPVTLTASESTYDLEPPSGYVVSTITALWYSSQPLEPKPTDELKSIRADWNTWLGSPLYFFQETTDTVRLVPAPDATAIAAASTITLRTALQPTQDSDGIEDWIFEEWVETIADGVKGRMMATPSKPWTNLELAAYFQQRYAAGLNKAKARANKSLSRHGALRAVLPRFA